MISLEEKNRITEILFNYEFENNLVGDNDWEELVKNIHEVLNQNDKESIN